MIETISNIYLVVCMIAAFCFTMSMAVQAYEEKTSDGLLTTLVLVLLSPVLGGVLYIVSILTVICLIPIAPIYGLVLLISMFRR